MINLKGKIPTTVNEAIELLFNSLDEKEKEFILLNDSATIHHTVGRNFRNSWGLWKKDSAIVQDVKTRFDIFGHGDDCSGLIFAGLWAKVKGNDVNFALMKEAKKYNEHWQMMGVNPKTGEDLIPQGKNRSYKIEIKK